MELLINQVGYECDGHKVALLQTSPAPDLGGYVRLQRLDDGQILLKLRCNRLAASPAGRAALTGAPTSPPSRSPVTIGWRRSLPKA